MIYLSSFALSFALTLWLSRFIIKYLDPLIFLDHPTDRKLHEEPIPRFGGIAFCLVILVIGGFLLGDFNTFGWYVLGGAGLFVLGAVDDYGSLSWKIKLPVQLAIGLFIAVLFIGRIETIQFFNIEFSFPQIFLIGLFLFWFVGVVNSVNLIDGMDGLAGGYMLLTCFGVMIIGLINHAAPQFILLNCVFIGAMTAFLHFNQPPAKFFMGDSGSLLLGFHLAVLPLLFFLSTSSEQSLDVTPFIIIISYLLIDTTRMFYIRIRENRNPLMPDTAHLHHLMYRSSHSYHGTLITIFIILSLFVVTAVLQSHFSFGQFSMMIYLGFLILFVIFPSVTQFSVNGLSSIIRTLNKHRESTLDQKYYLRARYIPYLVVVYFSGLLLINWQSNFLQIGTPIFIIGFGILLLYVMFSPRTNAVAEVVVIGMGIFQGVLLMQIGGFSTTEPLILIGEVLRYCSLTILSIITVTNYIIYTENLTAEFWSVIDLMVVFILIGLTRLQALGIGLSPATCFELGIIYFSNKLFAPLLFPQPALAGEPAGM